MFFNYLAVIVKGSSEDQINDISSYLGRDSRPLFQEDLPEQYQLLFEALESFPYPDSMVKKGPYLLLDFNNSDEDLLLAREQVFEALIDFELLPVVAFASSDDEELEGADKRRKFFVANMNGMLQEVSVEEAQRRSAMKLLDGLENLSEILWMLLSKTSL